MNGDKAKPTSLKWRVPIIASNSKAGEVERLADYRARAAEQIASGASRENVELDTSLAEPEASGDLIERLEGRKPFRGTELREAANKLQFLRSALEPFARYASLNDLAERDPDDALEVPVRDLLAAEAAFNRTVGEQQEKTHG